MITLVCGIKNKNKKIELANAENRLVVAGGGGEGEPSG